MRPLLALLLASLLACASSPEAPARDAAVAPRCFATGVAEPRSLAPDFPAVDGPACAAVPEVLWDGGAPSLYLAGDTVGAVRCVGLPPGEARVTFAAEVRLASLRAHDAAACWCGPVLRVTLRLSQSGVTFATPALAAAPDLVDPSCRRGPSFRGAYRVPVAPDGTVSVRVELTECDRAGPSRCLFVEGTRLTVEAP